MYQLLLVFGVSEDQVVTTIDWQRIEVGPRCSKCRDTGGQYLASRWSRDCFIRGSSGYRKTRECMAQGRADLGFAVLMATASKQLIDRKPGASVWAVAVDVGHSRPAFPPAGVDGGGGAKGCQRGDVELGDERSQG